MHTEFVTEQCTTRSNVHSFFSLFLPNLDCCTGGFYFNFVYTLFCFDQWISWNYWNVTYSSKAFLKSKMLNFVCFMRFHIKFKKKKICTHICLLIFYFAFCSHFSDFFSIYNFLPNKFSRNLISCQFKFSMKSSWKHFILNCIQCSTEDININFN